jgi:hypothetical protein
MKISTLTLALMACIGSGCANVPTSTQVAMSDLPNCLESNYDAQRVLFTIRNANAGTASQQCLLAVGPSGDAMSPSRLAAGSYTIALANGGGGGAGGGQTGGGGGGAGAREARTTAILAEGMYKLTIGAGGPGGSACADFPSVTFPGGPGWAGSPSNIVRVATGEVILGAPGADTYARPSRAENERLSGEQDGHGGSGPGQATGGAGGHAATVNSDKAAAGVGASNLATGGSGVGGDAGVAPRNIGDSGGGGGGATSEGAGGAGGGETSRRGDIAPVRGSLGSGGGGGGNCDPGARGGHGYIALLRN